MNRIEVRVRALALAVLGLVACSSGAPHAGEDLGEPVASTSTLSGEPTADFASAASYLYFRCGSTSWDVSNESRLRVRDNAAIVELTYDVREPSMTDVGDDCVVTETPARNRWGRWQRSFGIFYEERLLAPASAYLRSASDETSGHFRVVYPSLGRYRVLVDRREGHVSVRKEAPTSGDIAWTLPGEIFATKGSSRRAPFALYHRGLAPDERGSSLSRIDTDGAPRWSLPLARGAYIDASCTDEDRILVQEPETVRELSAATGAVLWEVPLVRAPVETAVTCSSSGRFAFVLALARRPDGSTDQRLRAIERRTGALAWEVAPSEPLHAELGRVEDRFLVTTEYRDDGIVYRILDARDGHEIRSEAHPLERGYLFPTAGALYRLLLADDSVFRIQRILPETGRVLWSFEVIENALFFLYLEEDGLKVVLSSRVVDLSSATGEVRWSVPLAATFQSAPSWARLRSGDYVVMKRDYEARVADLVLVDGIAGATRWEQRGVVFERGASLFEGFRGRVYVGVDDVLRRVDPRDGRTLSTVTHPGLAAYALVEATDDAMYLPHSFESFSSRYGVYKLDTRTGDVVWKSSVMPMGTPLRERDHERLYFTGSGSRALLR